MNRPQRTHNPGNLRYAGQKESEGPDFAGFAVFPDDPAGWRALARQVKLDQDRGLTLGAFIAKYAPPNENDTSGYLGFVCKGLAAEEDDLLSAFSPYAVAGLIARMEGYFDK